MNNAVARTGSLVAVAALPALSGLTGTAYTDPTAMTASWQKALLVCAGVAAVGGLLALGTDNDTLRDTTPQADAETPGPGDCHSCGVEGPPTHVRAGRV